jgi:hypothetical protein
MGLALFKERRLSQRRKLTGLLPGRLLVDGSGLQITGRPVDISSQGMGLVVAKEIEPGTVLVLHTKDRPVRLQVAWGQPDFGKQDMFRYGLVTLDQADNLEEIFIEGGCLR